MKSCSSWGDTGPSSHPLISATVQGPFFKPSSLGTGSLPWSHPASVAQNSGARSMRVRGCCTQGSPVPRFAVVSADPLPEDAEGYCQSRRSRKAVGPLRASLVGRQACLPKPRHKEWRILGFKELPPEVKAFLRGRYLNTQDPGAQAPQTLLLSSSHP